VDEAVNLERANWVEECGRINAAYAAIHVSASRFTPDAVAIRYTEAQENLEQAKVRVLA
jgi:hypothetical protein